MSDYHLTLLPRVFVALSTVYSNESLSGSRRGICVLYLPQSEHPNWLLAQALALHVGENERRSGGLTNLSVLGRAKPMHVYVCIHPICFAYALHAQIGCQI
jgi:hypothetical protein